MILSTLAIGANGADSTSIVFDASRFQYAAPWELKRDVKRARNGTILAAPKQLDMIEAVLSPKLQGPHAIYVGLHRPRDLRRSRYYDAAVHVRLDNDPYRVFLNTGNVFQEVFFKNADLTGRRLIIASLSERPVFLDYVRFARLTAEAFAESERKRLAPHEKDVVGINDDNVWMWLYTSRTEWDFKDCVGQHKFAGYNRIYWMANAGALFYRTKVGTPYGGDAREFTRRSAYMVKHFKPLESAVRYSHQMGLEIYGWYRLNNNFARASTLKELGPGLCSEFFLNHPELRCRDARGKRDDTRYSFVFPEVRAYVIAICREMVEKGVDGLLLDLLRHPPLLKYEEPLIEGYRSRYGTDPRKIAPGDGKEWPRWTKYRASFFTKFIVELRAELAKIGRPVPIGVRVGLLPLSRNREWGMDVEEFVKQGLVQEICLMNSYLNKPGQKRRPDEIAAASAEYFDLCRGRNVKLIGAICGHSPERTREYTRFFHDAGYDGVAFYESDTLMNRMGLRPVFQQLKFTQRVEEPWLSASSARGDRLVPWCPTVADRAPWWQINLPKADTLDQVELSFGRDGSAPDAATLSTSHDGREWRVAAGPVPVDPDTCRVAFTCAASARRFRITFASQKHVTAELEEAVMRLRSGPIAIGEQRDGNVKITSHADGATVKPGVVFEAKPAQGQPQGPIEFFWDGSFVRTERVPAFKWFTPKRLRRGEHVLKVRAATSSLALAPSVDEIRVHVDAPAFAFGPLPADAELIFQTDFEALDRGVVDPPEGFFFSRGYGPHEQRAAPDGYLEVVRTGGSKALHLVWPGTGPRMKLHLDFRTPRPKGFVELDFMVANVKTYCLAGLFEDADAPLALYLNHQGDMRYHSGKQSRVPMPQPVENVARLWRRVKWAWDAKTDRQTLWVDDMKTPIVRNSTQRKPIRKGIQHFVLYFFENQSAGLYVDNLRAVALP